MSAPISISALRASVRRPYQTRQTTSSSACGVPSRPRSHNRSSRAKRRAATAGAQRQDAAMSRVPRRISVSSSVAECTAWSRQLTARSMWSSAMACSAARSSTASAHGASPHPAATRCAATSSADSPSSCSSSAARRCMSWRASSGMSPSTASRAAGWHNSSPSSSPIAVSSCRWRLTEPPSAPSSRSMSGAPTGPATASQRAVRSAPGSLR
ncbi:hypothetical protein ACFQXA_36980 [Nocardiopsis composta]